MFIRSLVNGFEPCIVSLLTTKIMVIIDNLGKEGAILDRFLLFFDIYRVHNHMP